MTAILEKTREDYLPVFFKAGIKVEKEVRKMAKKKKGKGLKKKKR